MKISKPNFGELIYKISPIATVVGGLLIGDGLGSVVSKGNWSDWMELATGLLVVSGSILYRRYTEEKYDPQICKLCDCIKKNEEKQSRLEQEIANTKRSIKATQQETIINEYLLMGAYADRNKIN